MSKLTFVRVQQDKRVVFIPIDACLVIKKDEVLDKIQEDEVLDRILFSQYGKCDIVYIDELLQCTTISGEQALLVVKHIKSIKINLVDNTTTVYFIDFSGRTAEYKVKCIHELTQ